MYFYSHFVTRIYLALKTGIGQRSAPPERLTVNSVYYAIISETVEVFADCLEFS